MAILNLVDQSLDDVNEIADRGNLVHFGNHCPALGKRRAPIEALSA